MKKVLMFTTLVIIGMLVFAGGASETKGTGEETYTLRIAHAHALSSMTGQCMTKMGDLIEEYSDGRIKAIYFPSGQLGDKIANMEGLRSGTVDMTECAATDLSAFKARWSVFSLPFLFKDTAESLKVFTNPDVLELLDKDCMEVGMKLVAMQDVGSRSIVNSKRPINTPADCKGLKLRSLQDRYIARGMELMGFAVVALGWTEVYPALQQGTIDGADNSAPFISDGKFYEVCKYYSITEAVRLPDPVLMSKAFYDKLPKDLQDAVDQAGKDFMDWQWDFYQQYEQEALDNLIANGVQINHISDENREEFLKVTAPVYEELFSNIPDAREFYLAFQAAK